MGATMAPKPVRPRVEMGLARASRRMLRQNDVFLTVNCGPLPDRLRLTSPDRETELEVVISR